MGATDVSHSGTPVLLGRFAEDDLARAVLSHWCQNASTKFADTYEPKALELLPLSLFRRLTNETVCEDDPNQLLFPDVFDIPFPPPENAFYGR